MSLLALMGAGKSAAAPKVLSFLQLARDDTDAASYTYASQNFGTTAPDRRIICAVHGRGSGSTVLAIDSVTIGGVSATPIVQAENSPTNATVVGLFAAHVPTGTSGDVAVTFSRSVVRSAIGLWQATGVATAAYDSASSVASPPSATTVDVLAGGFVVVAVTNAGASSFAWTGVDEQYDSQAVESSATRYGGASRAYVSADTPTLSVTISGSTVEPVGVFASW